MPKAKTSRKQLFQAALAIAGLTARQWAVKEGLTSGHLSMILAGKRSNVKVSAKIDAYTEKYLGARTTALAS